VASRASATGTISLPEALVLPEVLEGSGEGNTQKALTFFGKRYILLCRNPSRFCCGGKGARNRLLSFFMGGWHLRCC